MERVELATVADGIRRLRAWSTGNQAGSRYRRVEFGQLADGRWYAHHTGRPGGAYVYAFERDACERVDSWLAKGEWSPTPACFDARQQPADGMRWWRRGQEWVLGDPPTELHEGSSNSR